MDGLPRLVRQFRHRAGLTQQETADRAGVSVAGLRDLEQGRVSTPRQATLRRLATALGLSEPETDELFRLGRGLRHRGLRVQVLGPLLITLDGRQVELGSLTQRTLLGVLALSANHQVPHGALIEATWGSRARNAVDLLHSHVSRLRRRLRPADPPDGWTSPITATRGGYRFTATAEQLDSLEFAETLARARSARDAGNPAEAFAAYRRATALWRDEPFADLPSLRIHPQVVALAGQGQTLITEYADVATEIGRADEVLPLLRQLTSADGLHEAAHARLMIALAASGQQAAALAVFDELRRRLAVELGAEPGKELAEAHERVLRGEPTAATEPGAPVVACRQLPRDIPNFVGREKEIRNCLSIVDGPGPVVLVIDGGPGRGKTRLANHLAHRVAARNRFAGIQLYVDLRGYAGQPPVDPADVLASFLGLLGVRRSQLPSTVDDAAALLRDRLHDVPALMLLDNAAGEDQLLPLLPAAGANLVLVTSRRALAVDGARHVSLGPFTEAEATALLANLAGAHRVRAEEAAALRLIDRCDRLPLAVAVAGKRLRTRPSMRVADLADRLAGGDRLPELTAGNTSVAEVFRWSYRALDPELRRVFRLLGLHPGDTFGPASVAALTGVDSRTAHRFLDRLADEHLLDALFGTQYRLPGLIRDYAVERAYTDGCAKDNDAAVKRLLRWYLHPAAARPPDVSPQWNKDG